MKTSPIGIATIASHEGIVTSPYRDSVGVWTVFVGHTASAGPPNPATMTKGESHPLGYALSVFARDLEKFEKRVDAAIKVDMAQHEFDALVSFDFNTGKIHDCSPMRHLNAGNRAAAAASFMLWKKPPEIVSRRAIEMNLFRSGIYPAPRTTVYYADTSGRVQWSQGRRIDVTEAIRNLESASPAPAIGTEYRPVLRRGAEGEHVISLQTALNARAATLKLDGDFGPATDRAVRKFQATHGLQSDGIVGSETWGQLMTGES